MKHLFIILFAGLVITSCGGQTDQHQAEQAAEVTTVAELTTNPLDYEDKTVTFDGIIGHMCQTSGDKMRVHHKDDTDFSILVMLRDLQDQFEYEYEGMEVSITGKMNVNLINEDEMDDDHGDEDDHECTSTAAAIQRMEDRGIDPQLQPYIDLEAFRLQ